MPTDQELRHEMLQKLYEQRHNGDGWVMLPNGLALGGWTDNVKVNVLRQLKKFGLAEWQRTAIGPFAGRARITPDGVYDIEGSQVVIPPIEIADPAMPQAHPTHTLLVWLAFIAGIVFAVIGVVLVILGATGDTQIDFWGAKISTSSVGIAAIFIAAILIVRTFRRVLDSVDKS